MEDYPGIIKDWEKAIEKDSMSCPNCESLTAQLEARERELSEAFSLIQGWLNAEDEPRHAPPNLISRSTTWISGYGKPKEVEDA